VKDRDRPMPQNADNPRSIVVAAPRGFCAGVSYAIDIVEQMIERHGRPIYVRHEIVHNRHVVEDLRAKGAVFVDELADVPAGSWVVFSAHGVAPAVKQEARERGLRAVDATCPLVTKVHTEVLRYANAGFEILLVGHKRHVEVEGTCGHAPDRIQVVESAQDVESVRVLDPEKLAVVTQTTLSVDDTREIVEAIRRRFPAVRTPSKDDICYATQNRQNAVKALAAECDLILVLGSPTSSNSNRLAEVAVASGCEARLVQEAAEIRPEWLAGARNVGVTAGASTPESLVEEAIGCLRDAGFTQVRELRTAEEHVAFPPPRELRREG